MNTEGTAIETVKTFWQEMNKSYCPKYAIHKYRVELRDRRIAEYEFKVYPRLGESEKTAREKVEFWANKMYPDVLRIHYVGIEECEN